MNTPSGYGPPPTPQGVRGFTRQIFHPSAYRQQGSGAWAAASLILAIIGWVTLGCLGILTWPLGLLFGLIGMVGNKRAKRLSFAGFVLSGAGLAVGIGLFALGFHLQFMKEGIAEQAGAPVVAAIAQFKEENDRVPHNLDELVTLGYLPPTWDQGLDDIEAHVSTEVKGKKWEDFLRYKAGEDAAWEGSGWNRDGGVSVDFSDLELRIDGPADESKAKKTYGLVFVGIDGEWGTEDDSPVNQQPEKPYELAALWGGDEATRDAMKTQRDLRRMLRRIDVQLEQNQHRAERAETKLQEHKQRVQKIIRDKNLDTYEQAARDEEAGTWIKVAGETARLVQAINSKDAELTRTRNKLEAQMAMLDTQVEMAQLGGNKDEMAKLHQLLNEGNKTLEADDSYFAKVSNEEAAEQWFKENIR
jgi:hypothetical protein